MKKEPDAHVYAYYRRTTLNAIAYLRRIKLFNIVRQLQGDLAAFRRRRGHGVTHDFWASRI